MKSRHQAAGTLGELKAGRPQCVTAPPVPLSVYVRNPELLSRISGVVLRKIAKEALYRIRQIEANR